VIGKVRMDLSFVDTHVHFWDPGRLPYAWLAGLPAINRLHTPAELAAEAGGRLAARMVFVECDVDRARAGDEVRFVEELAAREPRIQGIVAFAAVDRGPATLAALDALRARPLVRGVRHLIQGQADPGFCLRPDFVAGVRACGERGLSFDICVKHHQLAAVVELSRGCPGTAFVLDHAGKPDIKGRLLDPWRAHVTELARLPNVACKLSGLVTEADPAAWTAADLRPYVDHLLASFGPGRLLLGSDWPVVKLAGGYARWLDAALALLEPLAPGERQAVLADNARRVYRLP
jgi:L-fuconolactonase